VEKTKHEEDNDIKVEKIYMGQETKRWKRKKND
jgi:hypothetical protein